MVFGVALAAAVAAGIGVWQGRARKRPPRRTGHVDYVAGKPPSPSVKALAPRPPPAPPFDLEAEIRALALRNPMRAMQLAREGLEGPALEQTFLFALRKLASVDLQGAAVFVQAQPRDKLQLLATDEIARLYFALGPPAALSWINLLSAGSQMQQRAVEEVAGLWAAQDRAAATRYVEGLPAGPLQTGAAAKVAQVIGATNAYDALMWALTLTGQGAREAALQAISGEWGDKDPAVAARWFAAQPVDTVPNVAVHAALAEWLRRDQGGALLFVRTLTRERQTSAMMFVAPLVAKQDPVAALDWAGKFSPVMRDMARGPILNQWLDADPEAAQRWMNRYLPPPARASILAGRK